MALSPAYSQQTQSFSLYVTREDPEGGGDLDAAFVEVRLVNVNDLSIERFAVADDYGYVDFNLSSEPVPYGQYVVRVNPYKSPGMIDYSVPSFGGVRAPNGLYRPLTSSVFTFDEQYEYTMSSLRLELYQRVVTLEVQDGSGASPFGLTPSDDDQFPVSVSFFGSNAPGTVLETFTFNDLSGKALIQFGVPLAGNISFEAQVFSYGQGLNYVPVPIAIPSGAGPHLLPPMEPAFSSTVTLRIVNNVGDLQTQISNVDTSNVAWVFCHSPTSYSAADGPFTAGVATLPLIAGNYVCFSDISTDDGPLYTNPIQFTVLPGGDPQQVDIQLLSANSVTYRVVRAGTSTVVSGLDIFGFVSAAPGEVIDGSAGGDFFFDLDTSQLQDSGELTVPHPAGNFILFATEGHGYGSTTGPDTGGGMGADSSGSGEESSGGPEIPALLSAAVSVEQDRSRRSRRSGRGLMPVKRAEHLSSGSFQIAAAGTEVFYILKDHVQPYTVQPDDDGTTVDIEVILASAQVTISVVNEQGEPFTSGDVDLWLIDPSTGEGVSFIQAPLDPNGQALVNVPDGYNAEIVLHPFFEEGASTLAVPPPQYVGLSDGAQYTITLSPPDYELTVTASNLDPDDTVFFGCFALSSSFYESFAENPNGGSSVTLALSTTSQTTFEVACHAVTGQWPDEQIYESFSLHHVSAGNSSGQMSVELGALPSFLDEGTENFNCGQIASFTLLDGTEITIPANAIESSSGTCSMTYSDGRRNAKRDKEQYPLSVVDLTFYNSNGDEVSQTNSAVEVCVSWDDNFALDQIGLTEEQQQSKLKIGHKASDQQDFEISETAVIDTEENVACVYANEFSAWGAVAERADLISSILPTNLNCSIDENSCVGGVCDVVFSWVNPESATSSTVRVSGASTEVATPTPTASAEPSATATPSVTATSSPSPTETPAIESPTPSPSSETSPSPEATGSATPTPSTEPSPDGGAGSSDPGEELTEKELRKAIKKGSRKLRRFRLRLRSAKGRAKKNIRKKLRELQKSMKAMKKRFKTLKKASRRSSALISANTVQEYQLGLGQDSVTVKGGGSLTFTVTTNASAESTATISCSVS